MTPHVNRRTALRAGLASLMPAPPPALFLATVAAVPMVSAVEMVPAISLDAVAAAPEVAARASSDPIFLALSAWEAADRDVLRVYAENAGDDSSEADARCNAECRCRDAHEKALNATIPTTLAGAVALARYYAATSDDPDGQGLTHLVEVLRALARASPG